MALNMIKSYSDLVTIGSFEERLAYLKCFQNVGDETFGSYRALNQNFYTSSFWRDHLRPYIITRDNGCDLGVPGREICGKIYIHHINPITVDDFLNDDPSLTDPENLICVSYDTHQQIHYGKTSKYQEIIERSPYDTCPWKGGYLNGFNFNRH